MPELDDHTLLVEFAREKSEVAFTTVVTRYVDLVYSTALRCTRNPHHAEEVTQITFIILARKAGKLSPKVLLSGWLYQAARLTASNFMKAENRRQLREQEAYMQSTLNEPDEATWMEIAPLLDEAMGRLGETDRQALVLSYFENKTAAEVGAALQLTEAAVHKRVGRALEKLQKMFGKRGRVLTAAAIVSAISVNSVHAAPTGLAISVSAAAAHGAATSGSTFTLIKGVLKIMAWTKAKTAIVVGVVTLLAAGTTTVVVVKAASAKSLAWADDPKAWQSDSRVLEKNPQAFILRPTRFPKSGGSIAVWGTDLHLFMLKNTDLKSLLSDAYSISPVLMVLPQDLPAEKYDLMLTLRNKPIETFQAELKKRFGLTAHRESRETDVLVLHVSNPTAPGLRVADPSSGGNSSWNDGNREITIKNQDLSGFIGELQNRFGKPVVDETGLDGKYDIHIKWKKQAGETDNDAYKRALSEQLGLSLVPDHQPMEMLIVEHVK